MLTSLRYLVILLIVILSIFTYLYFRPSNVPQTDILKTLVSTVLGGLITVFVTFRVNTYNAQQKSALEKKKDTYIPIDEELKEVLKKSEKVSYWKSLNTTFDFPEIDKQLERSYVFLPKKLKTNLLKLKSLVEEQKTINHYNIAEEIILNNFARALKDCYGDKGFISYENPDEGIFVYEFPKPYEILKYELSKRETIDNLIEHHYERFEFYESILRSHNEPLIIELPDIYDNRSIEVGEFIAEFYNFSDQLYENEKIKFKREIYEEIIQEIKNASTELKIIFNHINKKYERDKY
ncbi:hypothetical protein [Paenibacillus sp. 1001270B_150601_E10]|uniref:hypothetical protein n=1 Tax=Paenibacillus sp. 1001270B_150601_E10 TaxID=2787079 RepID=UPI00189FF4B4|nr:hypothetical protein [Paenibacillus sp. 1001270B_150601_E10]